MASHVIFGAGSGSSAAVNEAAVHSSAGPMAKRARKNIPMSLRATYKPAPGLTIHASNRGEFTEKEKYALDAIGVEYKEKNTDLEKYKTFVDEGKLCTGLGKEYVKESLNENKIHFYAMSDEPGIGEKFNAIAILKDIASGARAIEIDVLCSMTDSNFSNSAGTVIYYVALFAQKLGITHIKLEATSKARSYYKDKIGMRNYFKDAPIPTATGLYPMYKKIKKLVRVPVTEIIGANESNSPNESNSNDDEALGFSPFAKNMRSKDRATRKKNKLFGAIANYITTVKTRTEKTTRASMGPSFTPTAQRYTERAVKAAITAAVGAAASNIVKTVTKATTAATAASPGVAGHKRPRPTKTRRNTRKE